MFETLKKIFTKQELPKKEEPSIDASGTMPPVPPKPPISTAAAPDTPPPPKKKRKPKQAPKMLSAKELATQNNQPYVNILSMEINPDNISEGAFELDYNDKFVLDLIRAGYRKNESDDDHTIVDRWFTDVARSIVLEMHEQEQADPANRDLRIVRTKNLGNGRTEVS